MMDLEIALKALLATLFIVGLPCLGFYLLMKRDMPHDMEAVRIQIAYMICMYGSIAFITSYFVLWFSK
jgi:fumarate reductase subunit D